jgi:hypothetical protein
MAFWPRLLYDDIHDIFMQQNRCSNYIAHAHIGMHASGH